MNENQEPIRKFDFQLMRGLMTLVVTSIIVWVLYRLMGTEGAIPEGNKDIVNIILGYILGAFSGLIAIYSSEKKINKP